MEPVRRRVLADGLIAGSLAYAVVAVFISAVDLLGGRSPFFTASLRGEVLVGGADAPRAGIEPGEGAFVIAMGVEGWM